MPVCSDRQPTRLPSIRRLLSARLSFAPVLRPLLGVCLLAIPLSACDTISKLNPFDKSETYTPEVIAQTPGDVMYNEGLVRLGKSDYSGAVKTFNDIDKQYPSSAWGKKALLMSAYASYQAREYDDAAATAKRYVGLYPSAPDTPYAQYLYAMSYYDQIPDATRDQERTEKALAAMQELVERYPKSEYVADIKQKMQVARDQLAGREMTIGRFYLEKRNYTGAINRYRIVVAKFQTTRHIEEALMRLTEAYMALGVVGEAQTAAAVLGHNFPDSPWYKNAYTLLQSRGLEPREDSESWISRAFRSVGLKTG